MPDYIPPDTVTLSIYTGTPYCPGVPSGVTDAIKSVVEMTLVLNLVNKKGYQFGYDKGTRAGPISYYLDFTPPGANHPFRAFVVIRCNGVPSVGWDDFQVWNPPNATQWTLTGQPDYKLQLAGWGKRTNPVLADFNNYEDGTESVPQLHQVQLCSPPLLETTKTYYYGMASYPEGGYVASVKKVSTGTEYKLDFPDDCNTGGSFVGSATCCCMQLVIPPSTPPPPKP